MPIRSPRIKELDRVALTDELPANGLKPDDIGTVVLVHNGGEGYEVEFCMLSGETVDVVTLRAAQVRPIGDREVASARRMAG